MSDLEKLKTKKKQLDARIKAAEAREKTKQRKTDTRRKIILGGALLKLLGNPEDLNAARVFGACKNMMSEKDRALFADSE